ITLYTSCCNTDKGIYYYNTYENHQISAVNMHNVDLDSDKIYRYPIIQGEKIFMQN
ncbi:MAG: linear amide C-N hydrolase, partial [Clostridia bacterium]|nr:linear amide C-N hydrolase [Clostridia bacterium]